MSEPEESYDIEAIDLNKRFNGRQVLRDLNLKVRKGETFVLVGPSGIGKSVFLKHIAGLMKADSGKLYVLGKNIEELENDHLHELRRQIGMVFQSSALLNSLTVEENVGLALAERGELSTKEIKRIADEKLALVDMSGTNDLLPQQLSGGMKKRVAVARTLAMNPQIILFDEPTAGLDPLLSDNVDDLIIDLKKRVGNTNIVVSHDMISAFQIGDRIGLLHEGRIIAHATPEEFRKSGEKVVQEFIRRYETCWRDKTWP